MGRFLGEHCFALFILLAAIPWLYQGGWMAIVIAALVGAAGYEYIRSCQRD